jgi:hypothetical protein
MAVDGSLSTQWQTARVRGKNKLSSEWIEVDLGSVQNVSQVTLEWDAYFATTYSIDVSSNGSSWSTVFSNSSGDGGNDTLPFNTVQARYVRMNSSAWSSGSYRNWLNEFEVYASATSPAPTATPIATPTPTATPVSNGSIHVGDLDASSVSNAKNWDAFVTVMVHDANENALQGVSVSGSWSNGASGGGSCTTGSNGTCTITRSNLKNNVSSVDFSVTDLSYGLPYQSSDNHDPDGDSNGTFIVVVKP